MRLWQFWWRTLILSTQYNPPEFIELMMTSLTMALLVSWEFTHHWAYLVLSSSFAIGAAVSMWIREMMIPSPHPRVVQVLAILLLLYSFYAFADIASYM
jgi:multisubunit Na+/H+ antiporter MnhE subunit